MGICPKCKRNSVFYDPYFKMARCFYKSCGFKERVSDEKSYFDVFEKDTEDYERKIPSYDLSFAFLRKVAVAHKLKWYIKSTHSFDFFLSVEHYTGESATSLEEFTEKIKKIDVRSLEFQFYRGDFERWATQALGETELAKEIINLREQNPSGENLRSQLYNVVSNRVTKTKAKLPIDV